MSATIIALAAITAISANAGVFAASTVESPVAVTGGPPAYDAFLGFDVGEERRYALGPPGALRDGEAVTWGIRLDRLEEVGGRTIGVFELTHEERRRGLSFAGGIFVHWKYDGELRVNEFGFPEHVRFNIHEEHTGESPWRGELMSAAYALEGDEFVKTVRVPNQEWEFEVPIATHNDLDLATPAGMFLFRPWTRDTDFFSQPALLGFAVPETPPESWEQRFMFFRPTYPVRHPGARYVSRERDKREALGRYYVKRTVKLKDEMQLDIGGRTMNVRKLDISGASRQAYVDEFGRIVRLDIERDPWTRKDRYIRILFPSEY